MIIPINMSSQKGNVNRTRAQKYKNTFAFKSDLHSTNPRSQSLLSMDILHVCNHCKDIISWKIKYKKYKVLKQPKTCTICKQKRVKHNYHAICIECAGIKKKCAKCLETCDTVLYESNDMEHLHQNVEIMETEKKTLVTNFESSLQLEENDEEH